jgi:hypothetical protein
MDTPGSYDEYGFVAELYDHITPYGSKYPGELISVAKK